MHVNPTGTGTCASINSIFTRYYVNQDWKVLWRTHEREMHAARLLTLSIRDRQAQLDLRMRGSIFSMEK